MALPDIAVAVGIVVGVVMILTVCVAYLKRSSFGTAGAVLSVLGVLLIGMSVWRTASIEVSPEGLKLQVEQLQRQIEAVQERAEVVSRELVGIAANTETSREQILRLSRSLEETSAVDQATANQIRSQLHEAPRIDMDRLQVLEHPIRRP